MGFSISRPVRRAFPSILTRPEPATGRRSRRAFARRLAERTPWSRGGSPRSNDGAPREPGIDDQAGPVWVRAQLVQMAWRWLRLQPDSALSKWNRPRAQSPSSRNHPRAGPRHVRGGVFRQWRTPLGTPASRRHVRSRGASPFPGRRDAGVPRDGVPRYDPPWGEIRPKAPRTDPKPWNNAVPGGVKNISNLALHYISIGYEQRPGLRPAASAAPVALTLTGYGEDGTLSYGDCGEREDPFVECLSGP